MFHQIEEHHQEYTGIFTNSVKYEEQVSTAIILAEEIHKVRFKSQTNIFKAEFSENSTVNVLVVIVPIIS